MMEADWRQSDDRFSDLNILVENWWNKIYNRNLKCFAGFAELIPPLGSFFFAFFFRLLVLYMVLLFIIVWSNFSMLGLPTFATCVSVLTKTVGMAANAVFRIWLLISYTLHIMDFHAMDLFVQYTVSSLTPRHMYTVGRLSSSRPQSRAVLILVRRGPAGPGRLAY